MTAKVTRTRRARGGGDARAALFAAGAAAFAARGFDGAGVDEIAAAARVNKAMLYYYFKSKAGLYTAVLVDMFGAVADGVKEIPARPGTPQARLEAFVDTIARACDAHPHFPAIWLRELADEGRHLDPALVPVVGGILEVLARILAQGRAAGVFRPVHPLLVQFGIIGPLLVFLASASARKRILAKAPVKLGPLSTASALAHIKASTVAAVMVRSGDIR
jgi:AcrR family transcriptional regulator